MQNEGGDAPVGSVTITPARQESTPCDVCRRCSDVGLDAKQSAMAVVVVGPGDEQSTASTCMHRNT